MPGSNNIIMYLKMFTYVHTQLFFFIFIVYNTGEYDHAAHAAHAKAIVSHHQAMIIL